MIDYDTVTTEGQLRANLLQFAAEGTADVGWVMPMVRNEPLAMDAPKTKDMLGLLDKVTGGASTLVLLPGRDVAVERSVRNLSHVKYLHAGYLNVRDLLGYDRLVVPLAALDALVAHLDDTRVPDGLEAGDA